MKHIALIGLPGSGKSSLGRMLADELGMPFIDLDAMVEERAGVSIRQIFERNGEKFFRELEAHAVSEAASVSEPSVIATGGGVVLRGENVTALKQNGFVVFLDRPVGQIARDVSSDGSRPLVTGAEKLYELERGRRALYLSAADAVLRNDAGEEDAVRGLKNLLADACIPDKGGYAVIGDPISHTLSPAIHGAVFDALGVTERYSAMRVPRGGIRGFAEMARSSKLLGFNVTMPHKSDVMQFLDDVDEDARLCGAVNTVVVREGRLSGHNTDMGGLLAALGDDGYGYRGRNILILGAGGAARGAAFKAAREGAASVTVLSRRAESAERIALAVRSAVPSQIRAGAMSRDEMLAASRGADVLINATPLGMEGAGDDFESLGFLRGLSRGAMVCDLVYKPTRTNLLLRAAELGLAARNGLGMLIYQALLADELFLGRELDKASLYKKARERLVK